MQDDPPQDDNLKAKWEKLYRDVCNDLEEPAQQDECLEIGWQRDAYDFDIEQVPSFFGEEVQSNSSVSSEEESIVSDVYPAKKSKISVVASVCFVAFVSLIASNRRKLILFSLRLLALLLVTWILFVLRG